MVRNPLKKKNNSRSETKAPVFGECTVRPTGQVIGKTAMVSTRQTIEISKPQHPVNDSYRAVEREEVLEVAFRDFVQMALAAGWNEPEVALTLADIADDYVMALAGRVAEK